MANPTIVVMPEIPHEGPMPGRSWWIGNSPYREIEMVECPACGHTDDIQGFDVLGADWGCVFCTQCWQEIQL